MGYNNIGAPAEPGYPCSIKGEEGWRGVQGEPGPQGSDGPSGEPGSKGPKGYQGSRGKLQVIPLPASSFTQY